MQSKASFLYSYLSSTHAMCEYIAGKLKEENELGASWRLRLQSIWSFQTFQGWLHGEITFQLVLQTAALSRAQQRVPWSKKWREPWRLHFWKPKQTLAKCVPAFPVPTQTAASWAHGCQCYRTLQTGRQFPWFPSEWEGTLIFGGGGCGGLQKHWLYRRKYVLFVIKWW